MPTKRPLVRSARFTADEWDRITSAARSAGKTPSAFIRSAALGAKITARRGVANDAAVRELARIGNNINQIARVLNQGRAEDVEAILVEVLDELNAAVRRL